MGWTEYKTNAATKDEALKERILKSAFHFKGPHTWKNIDLNTRKIVEETEIVEYDFIDLAVLLGIREICYGQEGDKPLLEEEICRFLKLLCRHNAIEEVFTPQKVRKTVDLQAIAKCFREWEQRLVTGKVTTNDDGSVGVYLNCVCYMELWKALTLQFPGTEMDVLEREEYDDGSCWYLSEVRFLVHYGTCKKIDESYREGKLEEEPSFSHNKHSEDYIDDDWEEYYDDEGK